MIGNIGNHSAKKQSRLIRTIFHAAKESQDIHKLSSYSGWIVPRTPEGVKKAGSRGAACKAVAGVAELVGLEVVIINDRTKYANPEHFLNADVFCVDEWDEVLQKDPGLRVSDQELIHSIDHAFASICSQFHDSRIHSNRIFRTRFNAKSAKNTYSQVNIKNPGHLFNVRIRIFFCDYMNAARRTNRLTHHACHASRRSVLSFGKPMTSP